MLRLTVLAILALSAAASIAAAQTDGLQPVYLDSKDAAEKTTDDPGDAKTGTHDEKTPKADPVEIDKTNSRVTVAATVTGAPGAIELGVCGPRGKAHMAVIQLAARPSRIVDAMRALGVEPGLVPVANRQQGTATPPAGRHVNVFVQWHVRVGTELTLRRVRLEEFFWNRADDATLPEAPWVYAGSTFVGDEASGNGLLAADVSGSVATIDRLDTSALLYYGGNVSWRDVWSTGKDMRQAKGTPCQVIIEVLPATPAGDAATGDGDNTDSATAAPPTEEQTPPADGPPAADEKPQDDAPNTMSDQL